MKKLNSSFVFALALSFSAAAQPYDQLLTGFCFSPTGFSTSYHGAIVNGSFQSFDGHHVENLAEAPGGRVFGFRDFHLVEILPDRTIAPLFPDVVASRSSPAHMVIAADGTIYVLPDGGPNLRVIDTNGTVREIAIPAGVPAGGIDLAADQCTLYYLWEFDRIKRLNVCSETAMPDFAVLPEVFDVRVIPDGVLAATSAGLRRYDTSGNLVRTYAVSSINAIGLTNGGATAIVARSCGVQGLERVDLESGAITNIPFAHDGGTDIVPYGSWTAALGSHLGETIPTASEAGLASLAALIVLAAFLRLR